MRVGLFLHSQVPPITPDAWTLSRRAKDSSFPPASATWPEIKRSVLRCECRYNKDEAQGTGKQPDVGRVDIDQFS